MSVLLENIKIEQIDDEYILHDLNTGNIGIGETLDKALIDLLAENENIEKVECAEEKYTDEYFKERASKLLPVMIEDEEFRTIALLGLISSDSNRDITDIKKNRRNLLAMQDVSNEIEVADDKVDILNNIKSMINKGLIILDKDEKMIYDEDILIEVVGDRLYELRNKYTNYFDERYISEEVQRNYIYEKFGECEEPTYDYLWKVWYLGWRGQSGELHYDVGSAQEIIGRFLKCIPGGLIEFKKNNTVHSTTSGPMDSLIKDIWDHRDSDYDIEFEDETILSKKQKELVEKIKACKSKSKQ